TRQIFVDSKPTANISQLIIRSSQKPAPPATRNAIPSTYHRLVPQSPKSIPAAANHPTFRGRSLESIASAGGKDLVCVSIPAAFCPALRLDRHSKTNREF